MLELSDFNITARYPTHWGDMDIARHVNNIVYLRWCETIRVVYFEAMGMDVSFNGAGGVGPIIGWQDCKYIFPITHPDTAILGVRTKEVLDDRFLMETAVFSERHGRIAALSLQTIIPYDYVKLRKAPLPAEWRAGIEKLNVV